MRRSVTFVPRLEFGRWREILRNSFGIGSIQIVNVFYLRTNVLLLTLMTGSKVVGEYGLASTIVTFLLVIPNAFMTSMLPLLVAAPLSRLRQLVDTSAAYMTMVERWRSLAPSVSRRTSSASWRDSSSRLPPSSSRYLACQCCSHA